MAEDLVLPLQGGDAYWMEDNQVEYPREMIDFSQLMMPSVLDSQEPVENMQENEEEEVQDTQDTVSSWRLKIMHRYYVRDEDPDPPDPPPFPPPHTAGSAINIFRSQQGGEVLYSFGQGPKAQFLPAPHKWDADVLEFLDELQTNLGINKLEVCGLHKREGVMFRGTPDYMGILWHVIGQCSIGEA
jgi:hypothetical protein